MTKKQKSHALKVAKSRLSLKLKLENTFKRDLNVYFAEQTRRVSRGEELESIRAVLAKHYKRSASKLTGIKIKEDSKYQEDLEQAITMIIAGMIVRSSGLINKTTSKILRKSVEMARQELSDDGILFPSNAELNRTASNIFRQFNKNRVSNIAVSETQSVVEDVVSEKQSIGKEMLNDAIRRDDQELGRQGAELMESRVAEETAEKIGRSSQSVLFAAIAIMYKTWVTMGDSKVRPWHRRANYQKVAINEPFIVNGEQLMRPGDTSMGASASNVSHCRCSSVVL